MYCNIVKKLHMWNECIAKSNYLHVFAFFCVIKTEVCQSNCSSSLHCCTTHSFFCYGNCNAYNSNYSWCAETHNGLVGLCVEGRHLKNLCERLSKAFSSNWVSEQPHRLAWEQSRCFRERQENIPTHSRPGKWGDFSSSLSQLLD